MSLDTNIEGVVLRYSVGIGRSKKEAESALSEAKKNKGNDNPLNVEVYDGESLKDNFFCELEQKVKSEVEAMERITQRALDSGDLQQIQDARTIRYDSQTGLLKRAGYVAEVRELRRLGRYKDDERFYILFDADGMKKLNDNKAEWGWDRVDVYLTASGRAIVSNTRQRMVEEREGEQRKNPHATDLTGKDIVGFRPNDGGGDEILVDLACENLINAKMVAGRLLKVMYSAQRNLYQEGK